MNNNTNFGLEQGVNVTRRIQQITQPRGGYINPKSFTRTQLEGGDINDLLPGEETNPTLIGLAVDYLTRFMTGTPAEMAFGISLEGARQIGKGQQAFDLVQHVNDMSRTSIESAIRLAGFDTVMRAGPMTYRPVEEIQIDTTSVANICTMVERSLAFFDQYGPKTMDGLTFEGGTTSLVSSGDGDFMTKDTLWDFKVSKNEPKPKHTLQLLMYWRMGLHSIHWEYKHVKKLGIYNPRMNVVYLLETNKISDEVIQEVEKNVIGY